MLRVGVISWDAPRSHYAAPHTPARSAAVPSHPHAPNTCDPLKCVCILPMIEPACVCVCLRLRPPLLQAANYHDKRDIKGKSPRDYALEGNFVRPWACPLGEACLVRVARCT